MKILEIIQNNVKVLVGAIILAIIVAPFAYSVAVMAFSPETSKAEPFLERPDAKHEACVKDAKYMRFRHMHLLKDIRDKAMRKGEKTETGLKECRECHTSRERFCNKCHDVANLYPDCFGCHYYPK